MSSPLRALAPGRVSASRSVPLPPSLIRTDSLSIGPIELPGRVLLAPMAGVTDIGMRRAACRFGASLTVSEMVAASNLSSRDPVALSRAEGRGIAIHAVQIAGREAAPMAEAARLAEASGAAIIDINMGCPAKKVTGGYSGSALMRDLDHACRLIAATVAAVRVPVTLKMRLGWDHECCNAPELARRAEALGIALVTVHGRTRQQFYTGTADWAAVRPVVEAVAIPVVVNGDCQSESDAAAMLACSGAAAVMIGRAAVGQPWLVGRVAGFLRTGTLPDEPPAALRLQAAQEHLDALLLIFGADKGLRHARKHLGAYVDHAAGSSPDGAILRSRIVASTDVDEVRRILAAAFARAEDAMPTSEAA